MRKKLIHEWENLDTFTSRCKVYGGWFVIFGSGITITSIFVPDPQHEWVVLERAPMVKSVEEKELT